MTASTILLGLVPLTVALSFLVHWFTLRKIETPGERLPHCRGAYLAMSFQLLLFAWIAFRATGAAGAAAILVPLGMTFSFAGDVCNLRFPSIAKKTKEPLFWGIVSFSLAQFCYIGAFLSLMPPGRLVADGYLVPLLVALLLVPAVLFRLRVYNPARPRAIMRGAFIYGFILGAMAAVALSAAIAGGGAWLLVAVGSLFFLLSDAVMGETTVYGRHPRFEYQVPWLTYLIAQGCIITGTVLLAMPG